ncbi:hypothetical protein GCM10022252_23590 [Streptosporangium oxazolinicum]|uniref:Uncharacterized protein n=1 Tax=Streptosporangium oxazolinicum TaxID=909287 RepID=A0ABP8AQX6_9ACTN
MLIEAEWALWGILPGSKDAHDVLSCSRGRIGRSGFSALVDRYARVTPRKLPQVTIARAGADEGAHLFLAVQKWSDAFDGLGRGIAVTHCFCVPYAQAVYGPVSYEGLYRALDGQAVPSDGGPLVVSPPALDADAVAEAVGRTELGAAALLLTGQRVCVVEGDGASLLDRLRFLDTVAALLPYGFRTKLIASTWAPPAAGHRSRLFFAEHPSENAFNIVWRQEVSVPESHDVAHRYHKMLTSRQENGLAELIARFSRETEQRKFSAETLAAVLSDAESGAKPFPTSIDDLLIACADSIEDGRTALLPGHLARLDALRGSAALNGGVRRRRNIISDRRLLTPSAALVPEVQERLYDLVLSVAYGPKLTVDGLDQILKDVKPISARLLTALARMPAADSAVTLRLAGHLDPYQSATALTLLSVEELVAAGEREPVASPVVRLVCSELASRWADPVQRTGIGAALRGRGRLTAAVERLDEADADSQFEKHLVLLVIDYGPSLDPEKAREAFTAHAEVLSVPLLAALALLCDAPARRLLPHLVFHELLGQGGITSKIFEKFQTEHDTPEARPSRTRATRPEESGTDPSLLRRLGFTSRKRS